MVDNVNNELVEQEVSTGIPSLLFCTTRPNKRLPWKVWDDFIPTFIDGRSCGLNVCHRTFNYNSTNGTTGLRKHQSKCSPGTQKRPRQHEHTPLPSTQKSIAAVSSDPKQKKLPFLPSGRNKCTGTSDEIPVQELAFPDTHTDKNQKKTGG